MLLQAYRIGYRAVNKQTWSMSSWSLLFTWVDCLRKENRKYSILNWDRCYEGKEQTAVIEKEWSEKALFEEVTQKLRPKESKGASRLAEDYPRMRGYVLEAQRQGRATPWATESHHGEPLLASGITAFFSRL